MPAGHSGACPLPCLRLTLCSPLPDILDLRCFGAHQEWKRHTENLCLNWPGQATLLHLHYNWKIKQFECLILFPLLIFKLHCCRILAPLRSGDNSTVLPKNALHHLRNSAQWLAWGSSAWVWLSVCIEQIRQNKGLGHVNRKELRKKLTTHTSAHNVGLKGSCFSVAFGENIVPLLLTVRWWSNAEVWRCPPMPLSYKR